MMVFLPACLSQHRVQSSVTLPLIALLSVALPAIETPVTLDSEAAEADMASVSKQTPWGIMGVVILVHFLPINIQEV